MLISDFIYFHNTYLLIIANILMITASIINIKTNPARFQANSIKLKISV